MTLIPAIVCALQEVYDPESGLNVVDLGLLYGVSEERGHVRVQMTMTRRSCPLTGYISGMAEAVIRQQVAGIKSVAIELTWEPPWTPTMVADPARAHLFTT